METVTLFEMLSAIVIGVGAAIIHCIAMLPWLVLFSIPTVIPAVLIAMWMEPTSEPQKARERQQREFYGRLWWMRVR